MNIKESFNSSLKSAWVIIKLIVPIYILADILYYYNLLSYISFIVEPLTSFLDLPKELAMSLISGMFLNIYAAIAFAAPLDLSPKDWTVLGTFLGVCHSLIVESAIMKKIGISTIYSVLLRLFFGIVMAYCVVLMPEYFFQSVAQGGEFEAKSYANFSDLLISSILNASKLTVKIIILMSVIIFFMDFIKSLNFIKNSKKNLSNFFSVSVGLFLGITYGAGLLIKESQSSSMDKKDLFYVGTFLMICHSIIEDTLLFVIFGANFTILVLIRLVFAIIFAFCLTKIYIFLTDKYRLKLQ